MIEVVVITAVLAVSVAVGTFVGALGAAGIAALRKRRSVL